jgi:Domain of unknown function (DUF4105)
MSIFKPNASVKRRLFCFFLIPLLACTKVLCAEPVVDQYWSRLLHAEDGVSHVVSPEFFISNNGRFDIRAEQDAFVTVLKSNDAQQLACNFPARYKWLKSQKLTDVEVDLNECVELTKYRDGFQRKDFYLGYITEFLDSPASAFGHLMVVFHDPQKPMELADVIHFAADSNKEKGLGYITKGLSGGFSGYFVRDPFFQKSNEYLIIEQRAIHLLKIELTNDQIENLILHLYELRKAEFKYYFIDKNCAFQLADFLNVAVPDKNYRMAFRQAVLPMDVVRLNADRISKLITYVPTHKRINEIAKKLTPIELTEVHAVIDQKTSPNSASSDAVKELLALQYQYAFRRSRTPYPNHAEIDDFNFTRFNSANEVEDPTKKRTSGVGISIGLLSSGAESGTRLEIAPLASANRIGTFAKESQLDVLTTTLDYTNNRWALNELRLLKIASTPNALQFNSPWSWGAGISINRYNSSRFLAREFQFELGKTYVLERVRAEISLGSGFQNSIATKAYLNPKVTMLYQYLDVAEMGVSVEDKIFATEGYQMRSAFISIGNWMIRTNQLDSGHRERSLMYRILM